MQPRGFFALHGLNICVHLVDKLCELIGSEWLSGMILLPLFPLFALLGGEDTSPLMQITSILGTKRARVQSQFFRMLTNNVSPGEVFPLFRSELKRV
jgi:hypothetical protein